MFIKFFIFEFYEVNQIFQFPPVNLMYVEKSYKYVIKIIQSLKLIQNFVFENFYLNYKNIYDDEIKSIAIENTNLRKLVISTPLPFHIQYIEGLNYYEFPKFTAYAILFCIKNNRILKNLYLKKRIILNIFEFQRIKKDKLVVIAYKI